MQRRAQPLSIIEALAFGIPCITTKYRGIPELIIDGYNGFFVSPQKPEQIAENITRLWKDPDLYFQMSRNALSHYQQYYTHDTHLENLFEVIFNTSLGNS